jgi:circadian clock protein KaiC
MIHAASIGMNIQPLINENKLIVIRSALPRFPETEHGHDVYLAGFLQDILKINEEFRPTKFVFDELTAHADFENQDLFIDTFCEITEVLEDANITSLYVFQEPATRTLKNIHEFLIKNTTGHINLRKTSDPKNLNERKGQITITPNVGHSEGKFTAEYSVQPNNQLIIESNILDQSKFYDYGPFIDKLNKELKTVKSNKHICHLFAFKIDKHSEQNLTLISAKIQNAIRGAVNSDDILCFHEDTLFIYSPRSHTNHLNGLFALSKQLETLLKHITVRNIEVNGSCDSADKLIKNVANGFKNNHHEVLVNNN